MSCYQLSRGFLSFICHASFASFKSFIFFPFEKHEKKKTMIKRIFKRENIVATLDTLETLPFCRVLRLGKRKFYYNSCGIIWCVWFSGGDFNSAVALDFYYTWWYLAANWDRYLDVGKLLLGFRVCPLL